MLPTFDEVVNPFITFKKSDWAPKTAADIKRVIALSTELIGATKPIKAVNTDDVKRVRDILSLLRQTI